MTKSAQKMLFDTRWKADVEYNGGEQLPLYIPQIQGKEGK